MRFLVFKRIWLVAPALLMLFLASCAGVTTREDEVQNSEDAQTAKSCVGDRCHGEIGRAKFVHGPVAKGECRACLQAVRGDHPSGVKDASGRAKDFILPGDEKALCISCHKELGRDIGEARLPHDPVRRGACRSCHDPHGSANEAMLRNAFPTESNLPYATESYALCFGCHDRSMSLDRYTSIQTRFRNGDRNLHFQHTNREKGISCKVCHEPHAGNQSFLVRDGRRPGKVPINKILFTQTRNGGRCEVECHQPRAFDRVAPVR